MHPGLFQCGQETQGFSEVLILSTSFEDEESGPRLPLTHPRIQRDRSSLCNSGNHSLDGPPHLREKREDGHLPVSSWDIQVVTLEKMPESVCNQKEQRIENRNCTVTPYPWLQWQEQQSVVNVIPKWAFSESFCFLKFCGDHWNTLLI